MMKFAKIYLIVLIVIAVCSWSGSSMIVKRSYSDQSVKHYLTERTCTFNEICKEEFRKIFRCRCPTHYFCRSAGKYYNAYCSMTFTGYIWEQENPFPFDVRG